MDNVLLSVHMISYNQENYIGSAIKGVLSQKTNFKIELIISDDYSTDRTSQIIKKYTKRNLGVIKPNYNNHNIGSLNNFIKTLDRCSGKYIALCEGDDYWIDVNKLQKQVDFLETHQDYVICFHNVKKFIQETGESSDFFQNSFTKTKFNINDIIKENFIPTLSCVFRNNLFDKFPEWYFSVFPGDWILHILNARYGKIKYLNEIMGVYRIHDQGLVSKGKNIIFNYERYLNTFKTLENCHELGQKKEIASTISNIYYELARCYCKEKKHTQAVYAIMNSINISSFKFGKQTIKMVYQLVNIFKGILMFQFKKFLKMFKPKITVDIYKNISCTEFEVNNYIISEFILKKIIPIVGIHPFPLNELFFMTVAIIRSNPDVILEWGTNVGKSARIFYEVIQYFNIKCRIHSIDLAYNDYHPENPKHKRGNFVKKLNVELHTGDGILVY